MCKVINIIHGHIYIPYETFIEQYNSDVLTDNNIEQVLVNKNAYTHKHILLDGYFQQSKYYYKYRVMLLHIIYQSNDIFMLDNKVISIHVILHCNHDYSITQDDVVIALRLDDFIQIPCSTSDILPINYYTNILRTLVFKKLYIICDKVSYNWEHEYLRHFDKWKPIYKENTLFFDCAVMRDAPILIHSNSTLCWIMSFFSREDKVRYIPLTQFYKEQLLDKIETIDKIYNVTPLTHSEVYSILYKEDVLDRIFPLAYCIPDEVLDNTALDKPNIWAELIPGETQTYRFDFLQEKEYYEMYKKSKFAITQKKGGWDCLRHYEIIANKCIPFFKNLQNCPKHTLCTIPKQLILKAMAELLPYKPAEYEDKYNKYSENIFTHFRENCTTSANTRYILSKIPNSEKINNILLIGCDPGVNYTREMTWIGMIRNYSENKHAVIGEYPRIPYLYNNFDEHSKKTLHGQGFTYTKRLQYTEALTDKDIINKTISGFWDIIIFGKVGPDEGYMGTLPNLPLWTNIVDRYTREQIIFLYGGDECYNLTNNNKYSRHLIQHADFGRCFVRELYIE